MFGKKRQEKEVNGVTIHVGMPLVDKDSNYIGKVKEIKKKGFVVDRSYMRIPDFFVPYSICVHDSAEQLKLEISKKELEHQGEVITRPSK